jgi:hypothetical protein
MVTYLKEVSKIIQRGHLCHHPAFPRDNIFRTTIHYENQK